MISTVIRALQALRTNSVRGERKRRFKSISHKLTSQTRIIWQSLLSGLTTSYASFSMNQVTSRSRQKPNSFKFLATLSIISVETSSTVLLYHMSTSILLQIILSTLAPPLFRYSPLHHPTSISTTQFSLSHLSSFNLTTPFHPLFAPSSSRLKQIEGSKG